MVSLIFIAKLTLGVYFDKILAKECMTFPQQKHMQITKQMHTFTIAPYAD